MCATAVHQGLQVLLLLHLVGCVAVETLRATTSARNFKLKEPTAVMGCS
jgi:hypothetical protein